MDIYRFFNSKDVADHLREIGHEFDAFVAAYIVDHCDSATLDQKIEAWQQIIDTMPDCPTVWNHCTERRHESTHVFLLEYIDLQRRMLEMFEQDEGCVYFIEKVRYREWPEKYVRDHRGNWVEWGHVAFSSLAKCIEHLRSEKEDDGDDLDRYVISKIVVDSGEDNYGRGSGALALDGSFCPLNVSISGLDESDRDIADYLYLSFVELPVPFMRGDIVIDRTDPEPHPFVFDSLFFWDSSEYSQHGGKELSPEKAELLDWRVNYACKEHSWDITHMVAYGYELGSHYNGGPLDDPCDICSDVFGAGNNYLDLERYDGPFEGELKILQLASKLMKNEIDIGLAMNFARLVDLEARSSRIRHSYDSEYVESVRNLY